MIPRSKSFIKNSEHLLKVNKFSILKYIPNPRLVGFGLILIPITFLLLFTIGEVISGELSGYSHLVQIVPLVILAILARKKLKIAGLLLMITSILLGIFYAIVMGNSPLSLKLMVELVLFLPPFLAGLLFFLA